MKNPLEAPKANLLVLRSKNINRSVEFYNLLGFQFERHSHGKGPEHFSTSVDGFVFEIYPARDENDLTTNTRIGFRVDSVDQVIEILQESNAHILIEPNDSPWGRRAVVQDFDGHTVELLSSPSQLSNNESID